MDTSDAGNGNIIDRVERLFTEYGHVPYEGARREEVSALAHALQCAQLAEWAQADEALVVASLLHDVGHFLAAEAWNRNDRVDDRHEELAGPLLARDFGADVIEPIRLHVAAKRYLVRVDARYGAGLSPASVHSLHLQGGAMSEAEIAAFEHLPYAREAVQLRRWDDLAKQPGRKTPPLAYYLALLDHVRRRPELAQRSGIGALDVS